MIRRSQAGDNEAFGELITKYRASIFTMVYSRKKLQSMVVDYLGPLPHLHARDTSLALVSRAPLTKLESYKQRMGWKVPWYSSDGTDFNDDFGVSTAEGETFGLSVFLREGDAVFHTYFTTDRGLEVIDNNFTLLDWTPLGRQEEWEDSPAGWPQSAPYVWWRRHDEY